MKLFLSISSTNKKKGGKVMTEKEHRLVKKAIKGNRQAFEKLIKEHYEQIYRTAFLYVHNEADALDVVQEATYQAIISIHTLKKPEYFLTWFTKIVIRCSSKVIKKRTNVVPMSEEVQNQLQQQVIHYDDSIHILDAVRQLKESYQMTIILFYYHDYSIKMISEFMGIPEGTVKTNLSRGKEMLKKYLQEEESYG